MRRSILSLTIALSCIVQLNLAASSEPLGEGTAEGSAKSEHVGRVTVSYHDLDLHKGADARVLLERLERAAIEACGGNPKWHPVYEIAPRHTVEVFQECRREAIAGAVTHINAPALSHVFAVTYGDGPATVRRL